MKNRDVDMLQGALLPGVIRFAVPVMLTSILQLLFNAADLMVVGQYCGSLSVAAVGATGALTSLIVNLFMGFSVGAGVSVAHALGERDDVVTHRTVHTAVLVAIVSGILLSVVGIGFSKTFLQWMDTPENVLKLSAVYMRIYFCGMLFNLVYNFCASILRAAGDTKSPLIFLSFAGVLNVGLNVIFVRVFHMNVAGVALATALSQGVSAVLVVWTLMHRTDACKLSFKEIRFYKELLGKIVRIGLPAGMQSSLFGIANVMVQTSVNGFGEVIVSGNSAAVNIEGFVYMVMYAFQHASVNFVGQNTGAKQYNRVKKVYLTCLGCVIAAGLCAGATAYGIGPRWLALYIPDSPEAISLGMLRLSHIALPYFVCGMVDVTTGALRGIGVSVLPMIISVLGICGLRIVWIYTIFQIPVYHTPQVLYRTYLVSWVVTFVAELIAFIVVYRRRTKQLLVAA